MKRAQSGFTMLEIIIVFVLIAGLMGFVGPKIFSQMSKAKSSEAKIRLVALGGNLEVYKLEVGRYPDSLQDLVKQPGNAPGWAGPYCKEADLKDSWGNDYQYASPKDSSSGQVKLVSLGADGKEGGEGENRDIPYEK